MKAQELKTITDLANNNPDAIKAEAAKRLQNLYLQDMKLLSSKGVYQIEIFAKDYEMELLRPFLIQLSEDGFEISTPKSSQNVSIFTVSWK